MGCDVFNCALFKNDDVLKNNYKLRKLTSKWGFSITCLNVVSNAPPSASSPHSVFASACPSPWQCPRPLGLTGASPSRPHDNAPAPSLQCRPTSGGAGSTSTRRWSSTGRWWSAARWRACRRPASCGCVTTSCSTPSATPPSPSRPTAASCGSPPLASQTPPATAVWRWTGPARTTSTSSSKCKVRTPPQTTPRYAAGLLTACWRSSSCCQCRGSSSCCLCWRSSSCCHHLPVVSVDVHLPLVSADVHLPVVSVDVHLPVVSADVHLPVVSADVHLPVVSVDVHLPVVSADLHLLVVSADVHRRD